MAMAIMVIMAIGAVATLKRGIAARTIYASDCYVEEGRQHRSARRRRVTVCN
jgi:hypothetical protein